MQLRTKFNIALLATFAVGLAIAGVVVFQVLLANAKEEILSQARVMRAAALAFRAYTAEEIQPLLASASEERFIPHIIPSFAAQANMRKVQETFPQFSYREVALNPTNLADLAGGWERDVVDAFRADDTLTELVLDRELGSGSAVALAHPIRITDERCLTCHSKPEAAPASMIDLYGTQNGFGWKLNEVIGAQIVTVPTSVAWARAERTFLWFMLTLGGVFLVMLVLVNVLLQVMVVSRAKRIAALATEVSLGNMDAEEFDVSGKDEFAVLAQALARMRRSLASALSMLK